ncbi:penicillin-binding protein 1A [Aliikangiella sp. IMCC44632]
MKLIKHIFPKLAYWGTLFVVLGGMGFVALYLAVGPGLPDVESIRKIKLQTPMRVYSNDNQLIEEFGEKRRIPITLDQVPKDFINALLATEDQRFYQHSGVDLLGVMRAFINLAVTQTKSQGASTITMLVARNYYLSREKRFSRKFTEMFLAWKLESELSKNEILELFLNKIPFGHRAFGLGSAAQVYYGTTLDQLSLAQLATLAGIPKGQSIFNPISNPKKSRGRRNHVLGRMLAEGFITQQQFEEASNQPIETEKHGASSTVYAPHIAEMVRKQIIEMYGREVALSDGLKVYTTVDGTLQQYAQQALVEGLEEYDRRHGYRGPEQSFAIKDDYDLEQLQEWLDDIPTVSTLEPAIVTQVNEESAQLLLKNGQTTSLTLASVKWARQFVDENHRGPRINKVSDVLSQGDLIRVKMISSATSFTQDEPASQPQYELAQIPEVSGGLISLNPQNGAIESLIGGYDYTINKFNMVTQARRQPGSNIKPFIYAAAFDKNYTAASIINDMPIVEEDITAENVWRPKNDGDTYLGPTSLRTALRRSRNTVSVRLIREIGPSYTKSYLEELGFPGEHMPPYLSLALGTAAFTPLEVAAGYAILANGGYKVEPWFIHKIEDANGKIIFEHQPKQVCKECEAVIAQRKAEKADQDEAKVPNETEANTAHNASQSLSEASSFHNLPLMPIPEKNVAKRVIEARVHYLIDNILQDVIHNGTAKPTLARTRSPLLKRQDLAGKTGTTNDAKDAWFSGYNLKHVATTWVGFNDHTRKLGTREFGGRAALPIWQKFMEKALANTPQINHLRPEGITTVRIDPKTGLLATSATENPIFELFRNENVPTEYAEPPIGDIFNQDNEVVDEEGIF